MTDKAALLLDIAIKKLYIKMLLAEMEEFSKRRLLSKEKAVN